jgi:6-phosphogluconolactonase
MDFHDYPDREMMKLALARQLAGDLRAALMRRERVLLCVAGGTSPGPVFDTLSGADLDWSRVDVVLSDERWVPDTSARSNTALLRARLFQGPAAAASLIPLHADTTAPEDALPALAARLESALPVDVALLGMGADMHTASLFPGADNLEIALSDQAPALVAMRAPGAPEPRITLSARVLRDAFALHILITGPDKAAAIRRAAGLPVLDAPVRAVLDRAQVHWAE